MLKSSEWDTSGWRQIELTSYDNKSVLLSTLHSVEALNIGAATSSLFFVSALLNTCDQYLSYYCIKELELYYFTFQAVILHTFANTAKP